METKQPEDCVLLDVGCGNGLLGIFAKFCGFKKVILLDTDPEFVLASKILAEKLHIDIADFFTGELSLLHQGPNLPLIDIVIGTDMVEHIYNLNLFVKELARLNTELTVAFSTSANPKNPMVVKKIQREQVKDELLGDSNPGVAEKGKTTIPFLEIRREIIAENFPLLDQQYVEILAVATRGLRQEDILGAVETYMDKGVFPQPALDKNTCNPVTGSWTERLCPLSEYEECFSKAGFDCHFYSGFYNQWQSGVRGFVKRMLNQVIRRSGLLFSPYFIILANKKK